MALLATAFIGLVPQLNPAAFVAAGAKAGSSAGAGAGKGFSKGFQGNSKGLFKNLSSQFAGAANLLVPLGIVAAVAKIGQIGMAYQDNLNIFQAVTKATGVQMDAVAEKARALGADITLPGVSAAGAAAAMTELSKAGFTVQQSMDAARATLQLARISEIDEADAAVIAANAVNAFGIAAKDTTFVVDELAAAANSSSVDIHDVELSFRQASAVFSGFQGPVVGSKEAITELNTAIAILGNNGIRGSDAGTSLKQMLLQLTGPTERAKVVMAELALRAQGANVSLEDQEKIIRGSKKVRDAALESIKKNNKGIKDSGDIAYTASGQMRSLTEIIDLVTRGTKGMTDENRNAAITQVFGADATRAIIALMKGGLPVYEAMRKAVLAQGAAADFAAAKNAGVKGSLDNIRSQLENIAIELFNQVKGPLREAFNSLAQGLQPLPGQIASLGKFIRDNAGAFSFLAHAIGIASAAFVTYKLAILATLAVQKTLAVASAISAFIQLAAGVRSAAGAFALLDAAMAANPVGIVVVAIAALVAGLIYAYKHSKAFRDIVDAVGRALKTAFLATVHFITGTLIPSLVRAFNQAKDAALFLYHKGILPAWNGIKTAVGFVIAYVKAEIKIVMIVFNALKTAVFAVGHAFAVAWKAVASAVTTAYNYTLKPTFAVLGKAFEILRIIVLIVVYAIRNVIVKILTPVINGLKIAWNAVFGFLVKMINVWVDGFKIGVAIFNKYITGPVKEGLSKLREGFVIEFTKIKNLVVLVFNAVKTALVTAYKYTLKPTFDLITVAWRGVSTYISNAYNNYIKPIFNALIKVVKKDLVGGFNTGVQAVKSAWDKLKQYSKEPIKFVVNQVINPFITGLNKAADSVGVPKKYRVKPVVLGFAGGGQIPGTPVFGRDNQLAMGPNGLLKVGSGEFIINARSTMANFPLIDAINSAQGRLTSGQINPLMDGKGYKDGGLVGDVGGGISNFFGKVVNGVKTGIGFLTDPIGSIKKLIDAGLSHVPGAGIAVELIKGTAKTFASGAAQWLKDKLGAFGGGGGGSKSLGPFPPWPSSPGASRGDSGVWRNIVALIRSTGPLSGSFGNAYRPGDPLWHGSGRAVDWMGFGQDRLATFLSTVRPLELIHRTNQRDYAYTRGVNKGSFNETLMNQHRNHVHIAMAMGGLISKMTGMPLGLYDKGGWWPSGTLGINMSGKSEYVNAPGGHGGEVHVHVHNEGVIGSETELDRWLSKSIIRLKKERKLP